MTDQKFIPLNSAIDASSTIVPNLTLYMATPVYGMTQNSYPAVSSNTTITVTGQKADPCAEGHKFAEVRDGTFLFCRRCGEIVEIGEGEK